MAGKRPDQYQITPREAGTSDYKRSSEVAVGNDSDSDVREGDKQRLAQSRERAEGQPFLPDVPAPSAEANRAAQARDGRLPADEAQGGIEDTQADREVER
ncbi:MAG TPA: hypothetical protein VFI96_00460 [Longimicrobiaceae bacterium]|nr:hypothetical protein [Longimicrobiaceae bacterium]